MDRERGVPPCRVLERAERGPLHALQERGFLPHRHGGLFLWLALDLARAAPNPLFARPQARSLC